MTFIHILKEGKLIHIYQGEVIPNKGDIIDIDYNKLLDVLSVIHVVRDKELDHVVINVW